jgi:tetratricopeptide (TPR) repeat protein/CHAT domain-containing protein
MWRTLVRTAKGIQVALLNRRVLHLYEQDRYGQALRAALRACDMATCYLEAGHPATLSCLNHLALLYRTVGEPTRAAHFLQRALALRQTRWGECSREVAEGLNNLAVLYQDMGSYAQAEPLLQQALTITCEIQGETHPDVATCLDNLASLFTSIGHYPEAERLYEQALAMKRLLLGEQDPAVGLSLNNLALLQRQIGNVVRARLLLQEALSILFPVLGATHPHVCTALHNLAELYCAMGDYELAEPVLQQALTLSRTVAGETHPHTATSLNNLAGLYTAWGRYSEAEALLLQALGIRRAALGARHPDVAQNLNNLAVIYTKVGRYAQAEAYFHQAEALVRAALGEQHPEVASGLNNLAELYRIWGKYDLAEPLLQQALMIQLAATGTRHPDVAHSLNNLALVYEEIGDLAAARRYHRQALAIRRTVSGDRHPDVALSLNNLAAVLQASGYPARARILYQRSLAIKRTALGETHPSFATGLHNLATLAELAGETAEAGRLYWQALELRRKRLGEEHPEVALNWNNLGVLYESLGDVARAEEFYQKSLTIHCATPGAIHPAAAQSVHNLALLSAATHREAEALNLLQQLWAIHDRLIGQVFSIGSERQRLEYLTNIQATVDISLSLILQHFQHIPHAVQEALQLVLRRKGIAAEALAAQRLALWSDRYPALAPSLQQLTLIQSQIAQKTLEGPASESPETWRQRLRDWESQREHLEVELARQIPEMSRARASQSITVHLLLSALPPGTALIEFVRCRTFNFQEVPAARKARWQGERYLAFVLSARQPAGGQLVDLGDASWIDQQIAAFRRAVTSETENGLSRKLRLATAHPAQTGETYPGRALRKAVFDPLLPALAGCERLILATDGDLSQVPFETLPAGEGRYLIDDYQLSYLSTGRDLLRSGSGSATRPSPPLVIANPDFDLCADSSPAEPQLTELVGRDEQRLFAFLPGTQMEGERIAAFLGVEPWLRERALKANLKAHCSPSLLHIATHGFFFPVGPEDMSQTRPAYAGRLAQFRQRGAKNPLLCSGLALAGANTWNRAGILPPAAEDGILTAEDVSGLDLSATELVVLSACQTGLGEVRIGEGVFGLRRAFVVAGAHTLIISLWKVPDEQTQALMVDFYQRILAGQPRAVALRAAQLAIKARDPHPYYWGAFICQGDSGPLSLPV